MSYYGASIREVNDTIVLNQLNAFSKICLSKTFEKTFRYYAGWTTEINSQAVRAVTERNIQTDYCIPAAHARGLIHVQRLIVGCGLICEDEFF